MKRAQGLSINTMILLALGVIVLVILVVFIQSQFQKTGQKTEEIQKQTELKPDKCANLFIGRGCYDSKCPDNYRQVYSTTNQWTDCGNKVCCEPQ